MRSISRRGEPENLEQARRLVSTAEREALDRAQQLALAWAERIGGDNPASLAADSVVESLKQTCEELAAEVSTLRAELEASRPLSVDAAGEDPEPATPAHDNSQPPQVLFSTFLDRMSDGTERLAGAAVDSANLIRSQAEAELAEARLERDTILEAARKEADEFLARTRLAVEKDTEECDRTRQQVDRDAEAAKAERASAERELADAREEAARLVTHARREAEQMLANAIEAVERNTQIGRDARRRAEQDAEIINAGREASERQLLEARDEAVRLVADARSEAERLLSDAREEIAELRRAAKESIDTEVASARGAIARELTEARTVLDDSYQQIRQTLSEKIEHSNGQSPVLDLTQNPPGEETHHPEPGVDFGAIG